MFSWTGGPRLQVALQEFSTILAKGVPTQSATSTAYTVKGISSRQQFDTQGGAGGESIKAPEPLASSSILVPGPESVEISGRQRDIYLYKYIHITLLRDGLGIIAGK